MNLPTASAVTSRVAAATISVASSDRAALARATIPRKSGNQPNPKRDYGANEQAHHDRKGEVEIGIARNWRLVEDHDAGLTGNGFWEAQGVIDAGHRPSCLVCSKGTQS